MGVILIFRQNAKLEIRGYEKEAMRVMKSKKPATVTTRKGKTALVRGQDVLVSEIISAEEEAIARAAEEKEHKDNPNTGRDPKLTTVKKN